MLIAPDSNTHLTYCLNVHRGETWRENFAAIREHALAVRDRVSCGKKFGLGLRLSESAASELASTQVLQAFKEFLASENLYVFTINGFPFGRFHGARVKENVYAPDWRSPERLAYTTLLADILAEILPGDIEGSISTVPCSFKPWITNENEVREMAAALASCAKYLAEIERRAGKRIHLGLEPEPACFLETTNETIAFFNGPLREAAPRDLIHKHLGVCFDTCHLAIQFEDLAESLRVFQNADIRISKVQLSAALRAHANAESWRALEDFCEPVYLHQVKAQSRSSGNMLSWNDLPEALRELGQCDVHEARVHFHVPLFCEKYDALESTASLLTPEFFSLIADGRAPHWEIETYTWDVLPPELRTIGIVESIVREFDWVGRECGMMNDE